MVSEKHCVQFLYCVGLFELVEEACQSIVPFHFWQIRKSNMFMGSFPGLGLKIGCDASHFDHGLLQ